MTSNVNAVFIREDVFNAKMDAFMATIRLENEKLSSKIDSVQNNLNAKIEVLSTRMDGLEYRMTDLQNSISWSFTLAAVFVAVVGIVITVSIAFAPSIWNFITRQKRPELSRDEVKSLVAEQVRDALNNYFANKTDIQAK